MSDFNDEMTAANADMIEEAGELFTYDGAATGVGGKPLVGLFTEADPAMNLLAAGDEASDELECSAMRTLFAAQPPAKKRLVYNGVTYIARTVTPITGGQYRFRLYRA